MKTPETTHELIRRVALDAVRYGYRRYVVTEIPEGMDLRTVDRKVSERYGITGDRKKRQREREKGRASVQGFRLWRKLYLFATEGEHLFYTRERNIRDVREAPVRIGNYHVRLREGKVVVELAPYHYRRVRRFFLVHGMKHEVKRVEALFRGMRLLSFPGVLRQRQRIVDALNRKRKRGGLRPVTF
jgi:hypothetical protein